MSNERLQKILAQAGIASRRKAEELIQTGSVTVNGKVAKIGDKADLSSDSIKVDGKLILKTENHVYVAFYKPRGVISMMADPEGRPTLADYLTKVKARVFPIGRMDFNSEGILLLTNDGELAEKIQKSDAFPRVYHVKITGHVTTEMIERLKRGGKVGTKFVKPHSVRIAQELNKKTRIEIVFLNAANVDVKSYFEAKGFLIERIARTAFGHITLHGLVPGQYRIIPKSKFESLFDNPELGVKALELRNAREDEVLPKDQRRDAVDADGKIRIKGLATPAATKMTRDGLRPASVKTRQDRSERPARERTAGAFGDKKRLGEKKFGERKSFGEGKGRDSKGFGSKRDSRGSGRPIAVVKRKDRDGERTSSSRSTGRFSKPRRSRSF